MKKLRMLGAALALCRIVGGVFVFVLLLTALPGAIRYLEVMSRITTGVLKVPLVYIYSIFALFLVVLAFRFLFDALHALRSLRRVEAVT